MTINFTILSRKRFIEIIMIVKNKDYKFSL